MSPVRDEKFLGSPVTPDNRRIVSALDSLSSITTSNSLTLHLLELFDLVLILWDVLVVEPESRYQLVRTSYEGLKLLDGRYVEYRTPCTKERLLSSARVLLEYKVS